MRLNIIGWSNEDKYTFNIMYSVFRIAPPCKSEMINKRFYGEQSSVPDPEVAVAHELKCVVSSIYTIGVKEVP